MVDEMLDARIIVPSNSEWRSPTNLVAKKDGSTRITLDYRKLNEVTEKDAYPLPNINSSLSQLAGATYFTKLDLSSGYYQVPMEPESQKFTAFGCEFGLFEYTVMPMGLTNATATFQRLMNYVLAGLIGFICMVYLDDIIVFTKGPLRQHIYDVLIVAHRIRDHNLRLKLKKCEFVRRRIDFLGHTIFDGRLTPNQDKIETLHHYLRPKTITQVQAFLGFATFYRKYIQHFRLIAAPLYTATSESTLQWTPECQVQFSSSQISTKTSSWRQMRATMELVQYSRNLSERIACQSLTSVGT